MNYALRAPQMDLVRLRWCHHSLRLMRLGLLLLLLLLWCGVVVVCCSFPMVSWSGCILLCRVAAVPFWELQPFGFGILVGPGRRNASRGICVERWKERVSGDGVQYLKMTPRWTHCCTFTLYLKIICIFWSNIFDYGDPKTIFKNLINTPTADPLTFCGGFAWHYLLLVCFFLGQSSR